MKSGFYLYVIYVILIAMEMMEMVIVIFNSHSDIMTDLIYPILVYIITYLLGELILNPLCEKILNFYKTHKKNAFSLEKVVGLV